MRELEILIPNLYTFMKYIYIYIITLKNIHSH